MWKTKASLQLRDQSASLAVTLPQGASDNVWRHLCLSQPRQLLASRGRGPTVHRHPLKNLPAPMPAVPHSPVLVKLPPYVEASVVATASLNTHGRISR